MTRFKKLLVARRGGGSATLAARAGGAGGAQCKAHARHRHRPTLARAALR